MSHHVMVYEDIYVVCPGDMPSMLVGGGRTSYRTGTYPPMCAGAPAGVSTFVRAGEIARTLMSYVEVQGEGHVSGIAGYRHWRIVRSDRDTWIIATRYPGRTWQILEIATWVEAVEILVSAVKTF